MPVSATYKYQIKYNLAGASDNPQTVSCQADCDIYRFSEPDTYGAMALCYFKSAGTMKYAVPDKDQHGYELSTQHLEDRVLNPDGEWQSLHVRYLTLK